MRIGLALLVMWMAGIPALAQTCEPPDIPKCLQSDAPFEDQDELKSCQDELGDYRGVVVEFAACLRARARDVQQDALGLGQKFRCRAGIEGACE